MQLRVSSVIRIEGSILCYEQVDPNKPEYNNKMIDVQPFALLQLASPRIVD